MPPRRGKGGPGGGGLVAAATRVALDVKPSRKPSHTERQKAAWSFYDDIPELKELLLWRGNQLSKLRLFVAVRPDDDVDSDPIAATDPESGVPAAVAQIAAARLRRLRGQVGGLPEILRRLEINLEAVGECYLVGFGQRPGPDGTAEEWLVASVDEVAYKARVGEPSGGVWTVRRHPDDKKGRELDPELDDIFRIWMPHARWGDLADCAVMGAQTELELLRILQSQMKAEALSRVGAGAFTISNEILNGIAPPSQPRSDGLEPREGFLQDFLTAVTTPAQDPSDVRSVAPFIITGPPTALTPDVLRRVDISRQSDNVLDERIEARVTRLSRGLDAPPEVMLGHAETTFANADRVDKNTWEDYLAPRAELIADALTVGYLRPLLTKSVVKGGDGLTLADVDRLLVWVDPVDLLPQPDPADAANEGHDRFAVSDAAWRKAKGFDESDAPDVIEILTRAGLRRGILTADISLALIDLLGEPIDVQPVPGGNGVAPNGQQARMETLARLLGLLGGAPANGHGTHGNGHAGALAVQARRKTSDPGRDLAAIDRDLRTRLLVAADDAVKRALDRAGNRLRSKAGPTRETLRRVPAHECAAHLGPTAVTAAGFTPEGLLDGAFDDLGRQFMAWGVSAGDDAIAVVNRLVGGFSQSERDMLGLRLAGSVAEAWEWMKAALAALTEARLYDPTPDPGPFGEFDPSLRVPPGLVRQAVARAGGAAGLSTNGEGGAWITLADGGTRPAGGVATGEIMRDSMREHGTLVEGYEWDYGPARRTRPFPPHQALHGATFGNFDSDVLANTSGFPEVPFYIPGDHAGCSCDVIPRLLAPDEAR